jgi:ribonuclease HII
LVGVDEAGRGCLAGPVFAGAVYFPDGFFNESLEPLEYPKIDDSKKLSKAEREAALEFLHQLGAKKMVRIAVGTASVEEIEERNILGATTLAMKRALEGLNVSLKPAGLPLWTEPDTQPSPTLLVDGLPVKHLPFDHRGIVKGDGKSLVIALASILAKVERDRFMLKAHCENPQFGWDRNCGYGTAVHRKAIREFGPCDLHRKLFLRKILGA